MRGTWRTHPLSPTFSPKQVPSMGPELPDPRAGKFHASLVTCILNCLGRCFQNLSHCNEVVFVGPLPSPSSLYSLLPTDPHSGIQHLILPFLPHFPTNQPGFLLIPEHAPHSYL